MGKNCHIGAGAVLAGVIEPASATPVIVEDGVLVGANAVVIEGVHVGKNAVVAAGAVVIEDVPENAVVAGCPARVIKMKDREPPRKPRWRLRCGSCDWFDLLCFLFIAQLTAYGRTLEFSQRLKAFLSCSGMIMSIMITIPKKKCGLL